MLLDQQGYALLSASTHKLSGILLGDTSWQIDIL